MKSIIKKLYLLFIIILTFFLLCPLLYLYRKLFNKPNNVIMHVIGSKHFSTPFIEFINDNFNKQNHIFFNMI